MSTDQIKNCQTVRVLEKLWGVEEPDITVDGKCCGYAKDGGEGELITPCEKCEICDM